MGVLTGGPYKVGQRITTADGAVYEYGADGNFTQVSAPQPYTGDKTMVTSQPLPSDYALKPDALVQGARDAGMVPGLLSPLPNDMLWNMGMSGQIQQGIPASVGSFDPKTNKLTLTPEMLAQADKLLGQMGPLGDFGRNALLGKNSLVSQYATPTVPPAETFPMPIPRPSPPAPAPASVAQTEQPGMYGRGQPASSLVPAAQPTSGLTTRKVNTVPIDPTTGLPILTSTAPTVPVEVPPGSLNSPKYWERVAANGGVAPFEGPVDWNGIGNALFGEVKTAPPVTPNSVLDAIIGTTTPAALPTPTAVPAPPQVATGDYGYNIETGNYELKQPGQAYSAGQPYHESGRVPQGTEVAGKDVAQITATPPVSTNDPMGMYGRGQPSILPQSTVPTGTTQVADAGIIPPVPFPYPLKPDTTKPPLEITIPGMGTQPPAVATATDTAPVAPPPSQASFEPGMMNRAPVPSPMVTLASGKSVPAGTQGTAQGGRYSYTVLPDGSVLNTTTNRISAPGSVYSSGPMPSSAPPSSSTVPSLLQGIQDVWNKTPMGHVSQYLSGQKPEGGLLSLVPKPKAGSGSGFGTYWDPRTGTFVGGGQ